VVIWTNGAIYIPVAFAFWHHRDFVSRYRTKNQIARILIYYVVRHHIPFSYLTFDNWYASKQNLRFFEKLGIKFVTRLRNNTWIIHESERKKIQKLIKYDCHYYSKLKAYVRQFEVKYPRFGAGYLAIVKNDKHEEPGKTKYLFTNDSSLTNTQFVLRYRSRWHVEIFFRTCKQYFGLAACQAQMMPQVITHVHMVFLAYVLTQLLMSDNSISMEQMQKHLRSLHCLCLPDEAPKLVSMKEDGALLPITLEELMSPIRTRIHGVLHMQIPDITESMKVA
jgi:transposase